MIKVTKILFVLLTFSYKFHRNIQNAILYMLLNELYVKPI
jgi:hypothetical protein